MPWTGSSFAKKHNHSLKGRAASKAAAQATAMIKAGVPEGEAIATANKHAEEHKIAGHIIKRLNARASNKHGRKDG